MPNLWIAHVKATQTKHGCTYKEALKKASKTYNKKQSGGKLAGDITRLSIAGIREGMKAVPAGKDIMSIIDPVLDEGLSQVSRWEKGTRPFDTMTQAQRVAYYNKTKRKEKKRPPTSDELWRAYNNSSRGVDVAKSNAEFRKRGKKYL